MEIKQTEDELARAEDEIRAYLQEAGAPSSPLELFDKLRQQNFSEYIMRLALWSLIDRDEIVITSDRMLDSPGRILHSRHAGAASVGR